MTILASRMMLGIIISLHHTTKCMNIYSMIIEQKNIKPVIIFKTKINHMGRENDGDNVDCSGCGRGYGCRGQGVRGSGVCGVRGQG